MNFFHHSGKINFEIYYTTRSSSKISFLNLTKYLKIWRKIKFKIVNGSRFSLDYQVDGKGIVGIIEKSILFAQKCILQSKRIPLSFYMKSQSDFARTHQVNLSKFRYWINAIWWSVSLLIICRFTVSHESSNSRLWN